MAAHQNRLVLLGLLLAAPLLCMAGSDPACPIDMDQYLPVAPYAGGLRCGSSCESMAGKVVVITGASTGLGRGIADRLAAAGAKVVGTSRNPDAYLTAPKCTYTKPGDKCRPDGWQLWQLDTTNQGSVNAFIQKVKDAYGKIDLLVLNAARGYGQNTFKGGCNDIDRQKEVVEVTYWGNLRVLMAARPLLPTSGYARVIIISSVANFVSIQGGLPYAVGKSAVSRIDEEWLYEYYGGQSNVKITTVFPGSMYTNFARNTIPACANQADSSGNLLPKEWQQWEQWQFAGGPNSYITAQQGGEGIYRLAIDPSPKARYILSNDKSISFLRRRVCTHLAAPMEVWPKAFN